MRVVRSVFSQHHSQSRVSLCVATIAIWLVIVGLVMLAEGLTGSVAEILLAVGLFVLFIVGIFRTYDPRHRASFAYDDQVTIGMDHGNISDSLEAPLLEEDLPVKEFGGNSN